MFKSNKKEEEVEKRERKSERGREKVKEEREKVGKKVTLWNEVSEDVGWNRCQNTVERKIAHRLCLCPT